MRRCAVLLKSLLGIRSFRQKSGDYVWKWMLRLRDNGKNMKLDPELINMDPVS